MWMSRVSSCKTGNWVWCGMEK